MDLSNDGTGPALIVRQHGAQPIAKYYDDTNMIMIIDDGGDVSFNENININKTLKVGGDASFNAGLSIDGNFNVDSNSILTGSVGIGTNSAPVKVLSLIHI